VTPIDPINMPPQTPQSLSGAEALRNENRGGGSGGGRRNAPEPEPEPEEEDQSADAHLEGDTFAKRRGGSNLNSLFADKMPWEQEEDEKKRKLAEFRQQRLEKSNTTRKGGRGPAPLSEVKPPTPQLSGAKGRQVDGSFDATTAVNSTLSAWQNIRDRQTQDQATEAPPARAGTGSLVHPLAGGMMGRPAIPPAPTKASSEARDLAQAAPLDVQIEHGPLISPAAQRVHPPLKVKAPPLSSPEPFLLEDETSPPATVARGPGTARLPLPPNTTREPAARIERSVLEVRKPLTGTGPLATPPNLDPAGRVTRTPDLSDTGPRPTPHPPERKTAAGPSLDARGVTATPPPGAKELGSAVASWRSGTVPPGEKAAPPPPLTPAMPPPSWAVEPAEIPVPVYEPSGEVPLAPDPAATFEEPVSPDPVQVDRKGVPSVRPSVALAACVYRVVDAQTNKHLMEARLELEPLENDMLPVLNGVTDALGWWGQAAIAPGAYRLSIRSAGYIPAFETRILVANEADDMIVMMSKP
jgi:hypothetical protein